MRNRCLLACSDVDAFTAFVEEQGHKVEPPKGDYEVFRVRTKHGKVFPVYTRNATARGNTPTHLTVYGDVLSLARQFYNKKHKDMEIKHDQ